MESRIVDDYNIEISKRRMMQFVKILKNIVISNIVEDDIILSNFNDLVEENALNFRNFFENLVDVN